MRRVFNRNRPAIGINRGQPGLNLRRMGCFFCEKFPRLSGGFRGGASQNISGSTKQGPTVFSWCGGWIDSSSQDPKFRIPDFRTLRAPSFLCESADVTWMRSIGLLDQTQLRSSDMFVERSCAEQTSSVGAA